MKRDEIKTLAICEATEHGLINLSRRDLCERAGIPDGSFPHVMGCNFSEFIEELKEEGIEASVKPVNKARTNPELRKDYILAVAVDISKRVGYTKITRSQIAENAGVSESLVSRYFGTMNQIKVAVMRKAVKSGIAEIVAQGIQNKDDHAKKASPELRAEAVALFNTDY